MLVQLASTVQGTAEISSLASDFIQLLRVAPCRLEAVDGVVLTHCGVKPALCRCEVECLVVYLLTHPLEISHRLGWIRTRRDGGSQQLEVRLEVALEMRGFAGFVNSCGDAAACSTMCTSA